MSDPGYDNRFDPDPDTVGAQPQPFYAAEPQPLAPTAGVSAPTARAFHVSLASPTVTYGFIIANIVAFIFEIGWGYMAYGTLNGAQDIQVLVDLGAKVNEYIALEGEWWRLFTAMFLHIGVMHLLFNLYALYAIGSLVEAYYGHLRFTIIYIGGGLCGSLASYRFSDAISAGASGGVFALAGAAAVYFFLYRDNFGARGRSVLQNMLLIIVVNLVFGAIGQGVDNWGHLGGLVGGSLLAWGLAPRYRTPEITAQTISSAETHAMVTVHRLWMEIIWVIVFAVIFYVGFMITTNYYIDLYS
jgi:rhomboid protease GluP